MRISPASEPWDIARSRPKVALADHANNCSLEARNRPACVPSRRLPSVYMVIWVGLDEGKMLALLPTERFTT